jgi:hypothetical protein
MLLRHGCEGGARSVSTAAVKYYAPLFTDALKDSEGRSGDFQRWLRGLSYFLSANTWFSRNVSLDRIQKNIAYFMRTKRYSIPGNPVHRKVIHPEGVWDFVEPERIHIVS